MDLVQAGFVNLFCKRLKKMVQSYFNILPAYFSSVDNFLASTKYKPRFTEKKNLLKGKNECFDSKHD